MNTNTKESLNGTVSHQYIKEIDDDKPTINWSNWLGVGIGVVGLLTGFISTTIVNQQKIAVLEEKVQKLSALEAKVENVSVLQQKVQALTDTVNELRIDIKEMNKELSKRNGK
ncbi:MULTISPECIES: hypothetical protein [Calothrix]|uniref:Uncharacterized protein n=2 Tax=Calothrix TaxID=1186 RepID=A0ABR8AJL9_9CYAN|nr:MULTISPECIES: hypothetical protein [Calothrix]MBD2200161.1 hypothetical protein [Calothrix parietina FACHB-288]MBD2229129.1 hypothetical protein [Calothrix anomala FACHB-343]